MAKKQTLSEKLMDGFVKLNKRTMAGSTKITEKIGLELADGGFYRGHYYHRIFRIYKTYKLRNDKNIYKRYLAYVDQSAILPEKLEEIANRISNTIRSDTEQSHSNVLIIADQKRSSKRKTLYIGKETRR